MNMKNPAAVELGRMGLGRKKTMSPEAIRQRKTAAKKSRVARAARKKAAK